MESYRVSVIVPVYNATEYLEPCVQSLMRQDYTNLEILLIDDGSTDDSWKLCTQFAEKDCRILAFHKENGGLISAWKYGVEHSTGDYLCFVDSDDWVEPQMIREMSECLSGNAREIVASDYVIERDDGTSQYVYQQLSPEIYEKEDIHREALPKILGYEHRYVTISRCMKLISRQLILDNMHYSNPEIRMGEDITIMLPCLMDCQRLVIMDRKAYYHYRYVTSSMIHKYDKTLYENNQNLRQIIIKIIHDKFQGEEQKLMEEQADKEYIFLLLLVLKNEARGNPNGCYQNIAGICKTPEVKSLVQHTKVEVREKSNQLLYFVLRHPNTLAILVLRTAMIWYYR